MSVFLCGIVIVSLCIVYTSTSPVSINASTYTLLYQLQVQHVRLVIDPNRFGSDHLVR
jgi:hypothetical protein